LSETLRSREEIPQEYKWRLEDIFASDQDWETMFSETEKMIGLSAKYQGQLAGGADIFVECMEWADRYSLNLEELFTYARMRRDEDNRISRYQGMTDRATMLSVQAGSALSFIVPEILAIPDERFSEIRQDERLQIYHHYLENILRQKQHVLSLAEEKILAETGELASAPSTIFSMANDADLKIGPIKDEEGREVELTKGNFIRYMESKDRRSDRMRLRRCMPLTANKSIPGQQCSVRVSRLMFFMQGSDTMILRFKEPWTTTKYRFPFMTR